MICCRYFFWSCSRSWPIWTSQVEDESAPSWIWPCTPLIWNGRWKCPILDLTLHSIDLKWKMEVLHRGLDLALHWSDMEDGSAPSWAWPCTPLIWNGRWKCPIVDLTLHSIDLKWKMKVLYRGLDLAPHWSEVEDGSAPSWAWPCTPLIWSGRWKCPIVDLTLHSIYLNMDTLPLDHCPTSHLIIIPILHMSNRFSRWNKLWKTVYCDGRKTGMSTIITHWTPAKLELK